jgi:hypothetical protein
MPWHDRHLPLLFQRHLAQRINRLLFLRFRLVYFLRAGEEFVKERCRIYRAPFVAEINDEASPDSVDFDNPQLFRCIHEEISRPKHVLVGPLADRS